MFYRLLLLLSFLPQSPTLKELCSSSKFTAFLGDALQFPHGRSSASISTLELAQQVRNLWPVYPLLSQMGFCYSQGLCWLECEDPGASCLWSVLASCVCLMQEFHEDTSSSLVCRSLKLPSCTQLNTWLHCTQLNIESSKDSHPEDERRRFALLSGMLLFVTDAFATWSLSDHLPHLD